MGAVGATSLLVPFLTCGEGDCCPHYSLQGFPVCSKAAPIPDGNAVHQDAFHWKNVRHEYAVTLSSKFLQRRKGPFGQRRCLIRLESGESRSTAEVNFELLWIRSDTKPFLIVNFNFSGFAKSAGVGLSMWRSDIQVFTVTEKPQMLTRISLYWGFNLH